MKNIFKKIGGLCLGLAMLSGVVIGISTVKAQETSATDATYTKNSCFRKLGDSSTTTKNGYKGGSSKNPAFNLTVTVGSGATELTFYAAAWTKETSSLDVIKESTTLATFSISGDSGMNNTQPFTLSKDNIHDDSYKETLSLSGITKDTSLTFAFTARCGIWDISYTTDTGDTWSVTYNGNGKTAGDVPIDNTKYSSTSNTVTVKDNTGNLTRTGYTFDGWNTNSSGTGTNYSANDTFTISSNTVLYAKWIFNYQYKHSGSLDDPFGAEDAYYKALETGSTATTNSYYIRGVVSNVSFNSTYFNYSFDITENSKTFKGFGLYDGRVNEDSLNKFKSPIEIENDDTVLFHGKIINYDSTTPETSSGSFVTSITKGTTRILTSVSISGSLTKTSYNTNDNWDVSGLTVTASFSSGNNLDITNYTVWSYSPSTPSDASIKNVSITASFTYISSTKTDSKTFDVTVDVASNEVTISYSDLPTSYGTSTFTCDNYTFNQNNVATFTGNKYMQFKSGTNYGIYTSTEFLGIITKIDIEITSGALKICLSDSAMSLGTSTGKESFNVNSNTSVQSFTPEGKYSYIKFNNTSTTTKVVSIIIHYTPFSPSIELDPSSACFTEGDSKYDSIKGTITLSHFPTGSEPAYSSTTSDLTVITPNDVSFSSNTFTINGSAAKPGTAIITINASINSQIIAHADFSITVQSAVRNLTDFNITTQASSNQFEKGQVFTNDGLVVTGTFDAIPYTEDITNQCSYYISDGTTENLLEVGVTKLEKPGNFNIIIKNSSLATITRSYSIIVLDIKELSFTIDDIGSSAYDDEHDNDLRINVNSDKESVVKMLSGGIYKQTGMQFNPSKGDGHINNVFSIPGNIMRLEFTWKESGKNSPTIYFSDKQIAELPTTGGQLMDNSIVNQIAIAPEGSRYFWFDGNTISGACILTKLNVVYLENDSGVVENFETAYLRLNDYNTQEGYCKDDEHHYYSTAKNKISNLTQSQKAMISDSGIARLQAWATANGETFNISDYSFSSVNNQLINIFRNNSTSGTVIIVIISLTGLTAIGGYFFYKKRKENIKS